ncbi:hypothetical protein [Lacrimispora sp.]|uniref:hypothetical protein n=1 Tax=Lacrimispora sp. TaxID=2719234 RepID=UPI0032E41578
MKKELIKKICFAVGLSMVFGTFPFDTINTVSAKETSTQKKVLMVIAPKDFEDCEVVDP